MLRGVFTFIVFLASTAVLGGLATVGSLLRPGGDSTMRLGRLWSRICLGAAGVAPEYLARENATATTPCVYISNHQSLLDIWVLIVALPVSTRFVAKKSLFLIPFFGWSIAAAGFIPIDRKNRSAAMRSLSLAAAKIRGGRPVLLFAEGTRSRDGRLGPFKRGAFHLAIEAGVPVVPVAISGSGKALPRGFFRVVPGPVRVTFCDPVDVAPYRDGGIDRLASDVRSRIASHLQPDELPLSEPR